MTKLGKLTISEGILPYTLAEDENTIKERLDNIIEVHTGLLKMGFGWVFPHCGYYSVGIAGIAEYLNDPKKKMREFLDSVGFGDRYSIKSHLIPVGGIKRKLTTSRVVLTGDAAGFVDSFYGEGISYAIRSGQIASEIISRIIKYIPSYSSLFSRVCARCFLHGPTTT